MPAASLVVPARSPPQPPVRLPAWRGACAVYAPSMLPPGATGPSPAPLQPAQPPPALPWPVPGHRAIRAAAAVWPCPRRRHRRADHRLSRRHRPARSRRLNFGENQRKARFSGLWKEGPRKWLHPRIVERAAASGMLRARRCVFHLFSRIHATLNQYRSRDRSGLFTSVGLFSQRNNLARQPPAQPAVHKRTQPVPAGCWRPPLSLELTPPDDR